MATKEQLKEERDKIVKGLEEAYRKLLEFKKAKNSPLVVVRNGKIVEVDPNDVPTSISYKRG
jgi:imidazolonepropionase-like amidohydrolase